MDPAGRMQLEGKVALVTGAGSGIGQACARLFASQGARVFLFDIDPAALDETLAGWDSPQPGESRVVDMTRPEQVEQAIQDLAGQAGRLDVLVNVAGGSGRRWGDGPAHACTLEGWEKTLDLNLNSVFYGCKYALQAMLPLRSGSIVNISSVLGLVGGDEDFATHAYAASKGAIISLTRALASYYAPQGIRANVICPGLIATSMSRRAQESEQIRARLPALQPLTGDFGDPQDVAQAALYLSSENARFVTGAVLTVDGGWTVR